MNNDAEILERLTAFQERERNELPNWEIRYWYERPSEHMGTPSHWGVIGYAHSRQYACMLAEALHKHRGWKCEVWVLRCHVDSETGEELPCPAPTNRYGD